MLQYGVATKRSEGVIRSVHLPHTMARCLALDLCPACIAVCSTQIKLHAPSSQRCSVDVELTTGSCCVVSMAGGSLGKRCDCGLPQLPFCTLPWLTLMVWCAAQRVGLFVTHSVAGVPVTREPPFCIGLRLAGQSQPAG